MYTDTDDDAQAIEKANQMLNPLLQILRQHIQDQLDKTMEDPCLPIPIFTSVEEFQEILRKRTVLDREIVIQRLVEHGISREYARSNITEEDEIVQECGLRFRKILCSSDHAVFQSIVADVEEQYAKYENFGDIRYQIDFGIVEPPPERPLEAFLQSGIFEFGIQHYCDYQRFKSEFRNFLREKRCDMIRWCVDYYWEIFEDRGLAIVTEKDTGKRIIRGLDFV